MPYRVKNNAVQVERSNGWKVLKVHKTRSEALAHLRALNANVDHDSPEKKY